jgi:hypothetical protein
LYALVAPGVVSCAAWSRKNPAEAWSELKAEKETPTSGNTKQTQTINTQIVQTKEKDFESDAKIIERTFHSIQLKEALATIDRLIHEKELLSFELKLIKDQKMKKSQDGVVLSSDTESNTSVTSSLNKFEKNDLADALYKKHLLTRCFNALVAAGIRGKRKKIHIEHKEVRTNLHRAEEHYHKILQRKVLQVWHKLSSLRSKLRKGVKILKEVSRKAAARACLQVWHQYTMYKRTKQPSEPSENTAQPPAIELRPSPSKSPLRSPTRHKQKRNVNLLRKALLSSDELKTLKKRK